MHLVLQARPFARLGISTSMKTSTKKTLAIKINWTLLLWFCIKHFADPSLHEEKLTQTVRLAWLRCAMWGKYMYTHLIRIDSPLHIDYGDVSNPCKYILSMVFTYVSFSRRLLHTNPFSHSYISTTRAHCILDKTYGHVMHTGVHRPHPLA